MKISVFVIEAMDCPTEEQIIRNRFKGVKEVDSLGFDLMNRRLTVSHRFKDDAPIIAALTQIGMTPKDALAHKTSDQVNDKWDRAERWKLGIALGLALGSEFASWVMNAERAWPVIAMAVAAIALGGLKTFQKGVVAIRTLTLNINFLMAIAIVGALAIGEWPEAAVVAVLFGIAEMIEGLSLDRARSRWRPATRSLRKL